jgi:hypothetical protein
MPWGKPARQPVQDLRRQIRGMRHFRWAALAATLGCQATPDRSSGIVRIGMDIEDAVRLIKESGGRTFECGYKYEHLNSCMTLRSGMTVHLHGSPTISWIEVCNSTILHCCKGETWYRVDSIDPRADRATFAVAPNRWVSKGMSRIEIERVLEAAGCRRGDADEAWLASLPKRGEWRRYSLPEGVTLVANVSARDESTVDLLILEATTGGDPPWPCRRVRVECELVDPISPLRNDWSWAFGKDWEWNPEDPDCIKRRGNRR